MKMKSLVIPLVISAIAVAYLHASTSRNITIENPRSVACKYQIADYNFPPGQKRLAEGTLASGDSQRHNVQTHSESSGDIHYWVRFKPADEANYRSWNGTSSHDGVIELR